MIPVKKSPKADTRTCDVSTVTKEQLISSSIQHINDVAMALAFFSGKLAEAAVAHDRDKLTEIDWFYANFKTSFTDKDWWDNHRKIHRHHLNYEDGLPPDVNLIDVLEYVADCVMAGMARNGSVYPVELDPAILEKAMKNTADLLQSQITIVN